MGNDVQQGTTSDGRAKKNIEPSMRWFYCTESDSSEIPVHQREYKQFNFEMSYIIEEHFVFQKVFESEKDGIRIFHNFQTGERHYMTKINDPWVKKEIIRQDIHCKPVKCGNFINERYSKTFPVELISNYNAFPNAYSIQMCLASYNKIFENVHYSKDDPFIKNFMKFSLFSIAVVVGLPKSSRAPIEHITSMKHNLFISFALLSSLSKSSKLSTDTA